MILLIEYYVGEDIFTIPLQGDTLMDIQDQLRPGDEILGFLMQVIDDKTEEVEYMNLELLN